MGANLSNFSGRAATAESVVSIIRGAPRVIEILSHCVFTREEARVLQTFFSALNNFISDTSPGSIVNAVGGLANLFLLTGTAIEWTNTEEALYTTTLFPYTQVSFGDLSNTLKSQLTFFYILSAILFNAQNGATSFGNGYAMLQNKNFLLSFIHLSGNNLNAMQQFTASLYKTFFFNNSNITMGNRNVVILFSPAILMSGALREVIVNSDCRNVGNDREGGVSPNCIKAPAAGLKINCGIYVNTDHEQVTLVSPANYYPALSGILRILGTPVPFRSLTRNRPILTGRGWAREAVLEACIEDNSSSSVSCFDGIETDRGLTNATVPQYARQVPNCFRDGGRDNFIGANGVLVKGGKKKKQRKCKSCGEPLGKGCGCGGGGGVVAGFGGVSGGVAAAGGFGATGFAGSGVAGGRHSSSSSSSSSAEDCCGDVNEPPLFDGSILQYLSSIQGAVNVMSLKLNRLLIRDDRDFNSAEIAAINGQEPYFRRCVKKRERKCRLPPALPPALPTPLPLLGDSLVVGSLI